MSKRRNLSSSLWTAWLGSSQAHACELLSHAILDAIYEIEVIWRTRRSRRRRSRFQVMRIIPNVRTAEARHDYLRHCPYCAAAIKEVRMPRRKPSLAALIGQPPPESLPEDVR